MKPCPKCGYERKIWNLSQYCPECKTNLMFYGFEDRFYTDAKMAEMSLANVRVKLQKVKTGLIGGKLQIARLVCAFLPLLTLFVPFGEVEVNLPVYSKSVQIGAIGLFSSFTDGMFSLLGKIGSAAVIGDCAEQLKVSLSALIACAVFAVLVILLSILCFISFKKMAAILCALSGAGIVTAIYTAVSVNGISPVGALVIVKGGLGALAVCAGFAATLALNLIIAVKGLAIEFKPGDVERVDVSKRLHSGELTLADIPYPVYQTEEEKAARQAAVEKTASEIVLAEKGGSQ